MRPKVHKYKKLTKKNKNNCKLQIGTYNMRSLMSEESLTELDNIGLSEVRRKGEDFKKLKSGHILYYVGEDDKSMEELDLCYINSIAQILYL